MSQSAVERPGHKCAFRDLLHVLGLVATAFLSLSSGGQLLAQLKTQRLRVATFNTSLNRPRSGALSIELQAGDSAQARKIAAVLRRVRPDVVLLNEFDFDREQSSIQAFQEKYLENKTELQPLRLPFRYLGPVNTGAPSGMDLNQDGKVEGPQDAFGFGVHEGQYGMVLLSRFPIQLGKVRTFRTFLWSDMPGARQPHVDGKPFYPPEVWKRLRLSSKSIWDVPIQVGNQTLHVLASHPTPPVFDGPEDRNGTRNHDEIRFLADYIRPTLSGYIYDDMRLRGGLAKGSHYVIAGDLNADPEDGDSTGKPARMLLRAVGVNAASGKAPRSSAGVAAAQREGGANASHKSPHATDTASFSANSIGNLRIDYVLPSPALRVRKAGVYWPPHGSLESNLLEASDHRLVWVDVEFP